MSVQSEVTDVVPDSADESTPVYSRLPGLLATPDSTALSPEIGPIPLFSPLSDASTHFSPPPSAAGPQPAAAASQTLFSPPPSAAGLQPAAAASQPLFPPPSAAASQPLFPPPSAAGFQPLSPPPSAAGPQPAAAASQPLFSPPASAAGLQPAAAGLQPAAAASQPLFPPEDRAAPTNRDRDTPDADRLAIERCITWLSQSPVDCPSPSLAQPIAPGSPDSSLALSAVPAIPGPSLALSAPAVSQGSELTLALDPGPVLATSAAAGSSAAAPARVLRWPAGSYGLDWDDGNSDGTPADSAECQRGTERSGIPPKERSSDQTLPVGALNLERWRGRSCLTEEPRSRRVSAIDYGERHGQGNRRTRTQKADGKQCFREQERRRATRADREESGSETRHQLSLLSRLCRLLNRVKNQLDDDGENITAARLRELQNRMRPCSTSLEALMNGHMTKEVSRRLARVREVSDSLLLRMKMAETRCRSPRKDSTQAHDRPTADSQVIRKRGQNHRRQTAQNHRRKLRSPGLPPAPDPALSESSPPGPPSPASPCVPFADEANTPGEQHAQSAFTTVPKPAAAPAAHTAAPAAAPAAPEGGAAPPAGSGGPWFWQWPGLPTGFPAWPLQPPWLGPVSWSRQPPTAPVQAPGSQPPAGQPDSTGEPAESATPQHSTEQTQAAAYASDCKRDSQSASDEEMPTASCRSLCKRDWQSASDEEMPTASYRSLLLQLKTVRLVDDRELFPLNGDSWDRPETLLASGDCWD